MKMHSAFITANVIISLNSSTLITYTYAYISMKEY